MTSGVTYHSGVFTNRRPLVLLPGLLATGAGSTCVIAALVSLVPKEWWIEEILKLVLALGVGGVLAVVGVAMLRQYARGGVTSMEITTEGIRYGTARFRWAEIKAIGAEPCLGGIQLSVKVAGHVNYVPLTVDHGLTETEYEALWNRLKSDCPHLKSYRLTTD